MNRRKLLLAASISCCAAVSIPASAVQFELIPGVTLTQVAVGRAEVWGVNASQQIYRFNATTSQFARVAGSLSQVAVGGGSLLEGDAVWGINTADQVFQYNFSTQKFVQAQGELAQMTVCVGGNDSCHPYDVWGINAVGSIFRYNYCTLAMDSIQRVVDSISTNGSDVWSTGYHAQTEVYKCNFGTQKWIGVPLKLIGVDFLTQLAVGVNDVWAIGFCFGAYHYEPALGLVLYPRPWGQGCYQVTAGADAAWGLNTGTGQRRADRPIRP